MPKINVYLADELAVAVRDAQVPVSAICQAALEKAVRDVGALRGSDHAAGDGAYGPFGRFTRRARDAIAAAQNQARGHRHNYVGTEHLLLGILDEGANMAVRVLTTLDVEPDDVRAELTASLGPARGEPREQAPFTPLAKKSLELTTKEALALGHNFVGCEHLLLGLIATEDGLASQVLRRMGVELRTTRRAITTALSAYVHAREQDPLRPPAQATLEEILRRLDAIEQRLAS